MNYDLSQPHVHDYVESVTTATKPEIIKHMSDHARSLARQLEKDMSLKGVEINGKRWVRNDNRKRS